MREEKSVIEHRVGLFVIIGLFLLGLSLFLLGEDNTLVTTHYRLSVKLPEVQGLRAGSIVSLSGIKVGNIDKIEFSEKDNALIVRLSINEKFRERIREGSTASVRTQGALGDRYIFIEPSGIENPVLKEDGMLVSEAAGDLLSALEGKGGDIEKVFEILNEFHLLLKRINDQGRSEKLMSNLVESSQNMREMLNQTKALMLDIRGNMPENKELRKSVASLASILKKVDSGDGTLGALINDPTLHNRLKSILGGSPRSKHFKNLIRETIQHPED